MQGPPATQDFRLSYSRLQSFKNCKAQYRFHYLDKLREEGTSIEAYLGRRLHEVLEWLYAPGEGRPKPGFDAVLGRFRRLWAQHWDDKIMIARSGWVTADYYQLGQRALAAYYRQHAPFDEPVEAVEQKISFTLEGAPHLAVVAIIDRLDREAPGHWVINDYKSGKRMLPAAQAQSDLQMQIYFLAVHAQHEGIRRIDVVWHYLQHNQQVALTDVQWNPERLTGALIRKGNALIDAENDPDGLVPTESPLCGWCHYWDVCPAKVGQTHPARKAD